jgi:hypothetical protein
MPNLRLFYGRDAVDIYYSKALQNLDPDQLSIGRMVKEKLVIE